jgi:hypothetical protein
MPEKPLAPDRARQSIIALSTAATNLNQASEELRETIATLEGALQELNLGISAWVTISGDSDERGNYWGRQIGYAKIEKRWCIGLRKVSGTAAQPDIESIDDCWTFDEAPRWMRIEGIGKITELLDVLTKRAEQTTEKIRRRSVQARELTTAIRVGLDEWRRAQ